MNVLIPIGGKGTRFANDGYVQSKPLVRVVGRPMIVQLIEHLDIGESDTLWIAVSAYQYREHRIGDIIAKEFPTLNIKFVKLTFQTGGAAETLMAILSQMSHADLKKRCISLDCDTVYFENILGKFRNVQWDECATFVFEQQSSGPTIFSYVSTSVANQSDTLLYAVDIQEKTRISNLANTGAYGFSSGELLQTTIEHVLDANQLVSGEFYTSTLLRRILKCRAAKVRVISVSDFACLGTPQQLRRFLKEVREGVHTLKKQVRRFCFDLDGTLVTFPSTRGDYSTCKPISKTIRMVRDLHAAGHTIIICTARRMKTHRGNVGAVIQDIGAVTMQTLGEFNIPYDELHFGKPYADFYIDDLAVNVHHSHLEKELGWHPNYDCDEDYDMDRVAAKFQINKPRSFNQITVLPANGLVEKKSSHSSLLNELFWYRNIPERCAHYFPRLINDDSTTLMNREDEEEKEEEEEEEEEEATIHSLTVEYLEGPTFSHLLLSGSLVDSRLALLMNALSDLHLSPSLSSPSSNEDESLMYSNLCEKLKNRFEDNATLYAKLEDSDATYRRLMERLSRYKDEKRGNWSSFVHGDPVLSNIIWHERRSVKFIDGRGSCGDVQTVSGDLTYDLAKVYQSLCGYHEIESDWVFDDGDGGNEYDDIDGNGNCDDNKNENDTCGGPTIQKYVDRAYKCNGKVALRQKFAELVNQQYGDEIGMNDIRAIAASLLFSLIPLHSNERWLKLKCYHALCNVVLNSRSVK